jgi:hypothetical protein
LKAVFEHVVSKSRAWIVVLMALTAAGAGAVVVAAPIAGDHVAAHRPASHRSPARVVATPRPVVAEAQPIIREPRRLRIASIGVDSQIDAVGLTPEGNMDVPADPRHVGWYSYGVKPGRPGDAVIDGHLDWTTGRAVFWRLHELRGGDLVEVDFADGLTLAFRVSSMATHPYNQTPPGLFGREGPARLSLITCAGVWNGRQYTERLVVDAALVTQPDA